MKEIMLGFLFVAFLIVVFVVFVNMPVHPITAVANAFGGWH